jgi:AraC-like DNA-binding protein
MTEREGTQSVLLLRPLLRGAPALGVDPAPYARRFGLDLSQLDDPGAEVSSEVVHALWQEVPRASGDAFFGLHLAELGGRGPLVGLLEHLVRNRATLGEAFEAVSRFTPIADPDARTDWEVDAREARVRHRRVGAAPPLPPHGADWMVGYWVAGGRQITGRAWAPREAFFQHGPPADASEYERFFRCPVRFDAPFNALTLPRDLLDLPVLHADPELASVLEAAASERVRAVASPTSTLDRLRVVLGERIGEGAPDLDDAARRLAISPRTLQRKLREADTSFQRVVDEARRDRVARHLADPSLTVKEVASRAGLSGAAALHRACVRWWGVGPAAWRQRKG